MKNAVVRYDDSYDQLVDCVGPTLCAVSDGPAASWEVLKDYGHRVARYGPGDAGEVLAYCQGVDLAVGAYEADLATLPGARLAVRWGCLRRAGTFTTRLSFRGVGWP